MERAHTRLVVKDFSSLLLAQAAYKLISFFIMIIIARFLGPDNFGIFSYGLSFVWLFLFISDFGFTEIFIRDVSRDKSLLKGYVNNILGLKMIIGPAVLLVIFFLAERLHSDAGKFRICLILGLSAVFDSFVYFFRSVFRVRGTIEKEAVLIAIEAVLKLGAVYLMIKSRLDVQSAVLISYAFLAASLLNLLINASVFRTVCGSFRLSFNKGLSARLLKNSFPFTLVYILSLINFRIDILMLSFKLGDTAAGWFSANYKLLEQLFLIPITLSYVYLPVFSRIAHSGDALHNMASKTVKALFILGIAAPPLFYFLGRPIISAVYGARFAEAARYLPALSFSLLPFFLKPVIEKVFYAMNKQFIILFIYLSGAALNVFLNCIAIPRWGINGSSLSTFLAECAVVIALLVMYLRYRKAAAINYDTALENGLTLDRLSG